MKNDEWLTPPEILAALGPFDLDPCAPIARPWPTARLHYTVQDDGLAKEWHGRVWCNPPFGREAVKWLRRMRDHANGIALIPARTETAMFYETVWGHAHGVLFVRKRPHFHYVDGRRAPFNSGAPIALVAYGAANLDVLLRSGLGFTVVARVGATTRNACLREPASFRRHYKEGHYSQWYDAKMDSELLDALLKDKQNIEFAYTHSQAHGPHAVLRGVSTCES